MLFEDEHRRRSKEVQQPGNAIYLQHGTGHAGPHAHGAHAQGSISYRNPHPQLLVQGNSYRNAVKNSLSPISVKQ